MQKVGFHIGWLHCSDFFEKFFWDTLDTIKAKPESFRTAPQLLIPCYKMTQEKERVSRATQNLSVAYRFSSLIL